MTSSKSASGKAAVGILGALAEVTSWPIRIFNAIGQSRAGKGVLGVTLLIGGVVAAGKIFGKLRRPEAEIVSPAALRQKQQAAYEQTYNGTVRQGAEGAGADLSGPAAGKDATYWQRTTGKLPGQAKPTLSQPTPQL